MLDKRQEDCIMYISAGNTMTDVSKLTGVPRSTIYYWINNDNLFKAELHRIGQLCKTQAQQYVLNRLNTYLANIDRIANMKEGDMRTIEKANEYMINRVLGSPTQVIEQNDINNNDKELSDDDLSKEFDEIDGELGEEMVEEGLYN